MAQVIDLYNYKYHLHDLTSVYNSLKTDPQNGLTTENFNDNLQRFGNNHIHLNKGTPWWRRLLKQFTNLFAILLASGSILCFIAYSLNDIWIYNGIGIRSCNLLCTVP